MKYHPVKSNVTGPAIAFVVLFASPLMVALGQMPTPTAKHPTEQVRIGYKLDLDVSRVEGRWVEEQDEARQGSIVMATNPHPILTGDYPDPENQTINVKVSCEPLQTGWSASLQEINAAGGDETSGILVITGMGSGGVWDITNDLSGSSFTTGSQIYEVSARQTGVTRLRLRIKDNAGKKVGDDIVRISSIPTVPGEGRIVFVNKSGAIGSAPYDDYDTAAAHSVADAISYLDGSSDNPNIVIGPGTYHDHNMVINNSCVIAGVGGQYDDNTEVTGFDTNGAPVIDAESKGRIFEMKTMSSDDIVKIVGVKLTKGAAGSGGAVVTGADTRGRFDVRCSVFSNNIAVGEIDEEMYPLNDGLPIPTDSATSSSQSLSGRSRNLAQRTLDQPDVNGLPTSGGAWIDAMGEDREQLHGQIFMKQTKFDNNLAGKSYGGAMAFMQRPSPETCDGKTSDVTDQLTNGSRLYKTFGEGSLKRIIIDSDFDNNHAMMGGAIWSGPDNGGNRLPLTPKMLMTGGKPIQMWDSSFLGNTAEKASRCRGGAVYLAGIIAAGSFANGCYFGGNAATDIGTDGKHVGPAGSNGDGGAIAVVFMATLQIGESDLRPGPARKTIIENNNAGDGGAGIYATYFSVIRVDDAIIRQNKAAVGAGGIHMTSGAVANVVSTEMLENEGGSGAAIHARNSRLDVKESDIHNNKGLKAKSLNPVNPTDPTPNPNPNTNIVKYDTDTRGGGIFGQLNDDSSYDSERIVLGNSFNKYFFPEGAFCPLIIRVKESLLRNNSAELGGALFVNRFLAAKPEYQFVNPQRKLLKVDVEDSIISGNDANPIIEPSWGSTSDSKKAVGGLALGATDETESCIASPTDPLRQMFNREQLLDDMQYALNMSLYGVKRWADYKHAGLFEYQNFDYQEAADYIVNNLLWGYNDNVAENEKLATDFIINSIVGAHDGWPSNTGLQASALIAPGSVTIVPGWPDDLVVSGNLPIPVSPTHPDGLLD